MKMLSIGVFGLLMAVLLAGVSSVQALPLGTNITIYDGRGSGTGWTGSNEDQEVEPNCAIGQQWDLEGFFLEGNKLSMVGGYNFVSGEVGNGILFNSGDIFIKTGNSLDYNYVLDMNFSNKTYSVYSRPSGSIQNVYYSQNAASNPWNYNPNGAIPLTGWGNKTFEYYTGLIDTEVGGLLGGSHNVAVVDLSFLAPGTTFTSHFTMGCGNDNLMGSGTTAVPEPQMMLLLGLGLVGIAGFARRKKTGASEQ
jgi:hypothetical protein